MGFAFNPLIFTGLDVTGGAGVSIGGPIAGSTAGSVLFVDSSNELAQDPVNFNYDDTLDRLNINNIQLIPRATAPTAADGVIYYDSVAQTFLFRQNGVWVDPVSSNFSDAAFTVYDNVDPTKKLIFQVSGVAPATTRTITMPDANVDLGNLTNSNVSTSAAIALSKLAALTINKALTSNASGVITVSSVTSTELGYVSGVTSAVQTQLDNKLNLLGGTMTGSINMGTNSITNMAAPSVGSDAATKTYVDDLVDGVSYKIAARAASIADLNLASMPATIDSIIMVSGDRFLAKDQTLPAENGIYIYNGTLAAATRSSDMNTWNETISAVLLVKEGTVNIGSKWVSQTSSGGTLGVTAIPFVIFAANGSVNGTGTANQVAYWTATTVLSGENQLNQTRGGFGVDVSGFTGVVKVSAGSFSASTLVNADVSPTAAITYSKLSLSNSILNADINSSAAIDRSKLAVGSFNRLVYNNGSGVLSDFTALTDGQLAIGSTGAAPVAAALTAGTNISITNGPGSITINSIPATGDIFQTAWVGPANNTANQTITSLTFANTVRSFDAMVDLYIDNGGTGLWATYRLVGKRKASTWVTNEITSDFTGDLITGISFNISSTGQVRVTTGTIAGYVAGETRFRAITLNN